MNKGLNAVVEHECHSCNRKVKFLIFIPTGQTRVFGCITCKMLFAEIYCSDEDEYHLRQLRGRTFVRPF